MYWLCCKLYVLRASYRIFRKHNEQLCKMWRVTSYWPCESVGPTLRDRGILRLLWFLCSWIFQLSKLEELYNKRCKIQEKMEIFTGMGREDLREHPKKYTWSHGFTSPVASQGCCPGLCWLPTPRYRSNSNEGISWGCWLMLMPRFQKGLCDQITVLLSREL